MYWDNPNFDWAAWAESREDFDNGASFNWDDPMSNFDTTEYMWYMNYNLRFIFTNEFEEDGRHWACDSWDNCVYLDVETQQLCDWNLDCYAPEEYYEAYFSFDDDTYTDVVSDLIGEVWGSGLGWCQSDLDEEAEAYSIEECWTACINNFGDSILAVDYNPNDGCYCQSSCDCLTEVGDEDIVLMVSEHLWNLPEICEGEEWNFREELFIEFAYQMQDSLASQDLYYDSEEEFYAELMPIFEEKWEELGVNEDTEDWQGTWDLLWAPVMDEFGVNLENWNYGADFDWEDWRSNFDMEEDRWYEHYDMSVIFPSPWNHEGIEYVCDFDDNCWYFNYDLQEACDMDGNCYTPEEALRVYFEGDLENWNYGADFDWEDWRSNFDMEEDRWYEYYDMAVIFPYPWNHEGIEYVCDEDNECWYFNDESREACDFEGNCYTPEMALEVYFEGVQENWNWGDDFDWTDWRSNFDMTEDGWYHNYDMSIIFPYPWDYEGYEWQCDENDECWRFDDETQEACNFYHSCYEPEEALKIYFEGKIDWNEGADFDWEDWRSNFDMTYDGWYEYYEWNIIFSTNLDVEGLAYVCDDEGICVYYDQDEELVCFLDDDCFEPYEALEIYFEHEEIEHFGISHGTMPVWCSSDLDEEPEQEAYSVEECWNACVDTFGYELVAVDFAQD
jgi:hypothetical protein